MQPRTRVPAALGPIVTPVSWPFRIEVPTSRLLGPRIVQLSARPPEKKLFETMADEIPCSKWSAPAS
jgi:hypothetical protein